MPIQIHGFVASGFEPVRQAFTRNFTHRRELGAACAVYYRGEKVVDLWGGYRDLVGELPWEVDTLVPVFSTTKGMSALAMAIAHSHGLFDYDAPVATYWPEFAQHGKAHITIRQLLAHQAGLAAIDEPLDIQKLGNAAILSQALAAQKPAWEPGTRHGYHIFSLGLYENELIRRVDPQGRTLGQYFHDELAVPLGLEFYIGLPDSVLSARVAQVVEQQPWRYLFNLHKIPRSILPELLKRDSLINRATFNPTLASINSRPMQRMGMPSMGGIGLVRDVARAYSEFATGGKTLKIHQETLKALIQPAQVPIGGSVDLVLHVETLFSLGFVKPSPLAPFGSEQAFGHSGAGGSFACADPKYGLAFAYAMNRMDYHLINDPREVALREAAYQCAANLT